MQKIVPKTQYTTSNYYKNWLPKIFLIWILPIKKNKNKKSKMSSVLCFVIIWQKSVFGIIHPHLSLNGSCFEGNEEGRAGRALGDLAVWLAGCGSRRFSFPTTTFGTAEWSGMLSGEVQHDVDCNCVTLIFCDQCCQSSVYLFVCLFLFPSFVLFYLFMNLLIILYIIYSDLKKKKIICASFDWTYRLIEKWVIINNHILYW